MVFEKLISKKKWATIVYIGTALIEVLGFALLFSKTKAIEFILNNSVLVAIILMVFGYLGAVSVRGKK